jgi:hypothetical protein
VARRAPLRCNRRSWRRYTKANFLAAFKHAQFVMMDQEQRMLRDMKARACVRARARARACVCVCVCACVRCA